MNLKQAVEAVRKDHSLVLESENGKVSWTFTDEPVVAFKERKERFITAYDGDHYWNIQDITVIMDEDFQPVVDWSKVKVDTKVICAKGFTGTEINAHFLNYEDGVIQTFRQGKSSWTWQSKFGVDDWHPTRVRLAQD